MSPPFRFRTLVPAILVLFAISAAIRWSRRDEPIVANIDASYHVLLTVQALNETPASVHHFLPIATLGRELDRDIRFGASLRGPGGIHYYTSFPPLGFVAPWAFFRITGLAPNVEHLLLFNLAIHLAATLLLAVLVSELAASLGADRWTHAAIVLLTATTYLFTFEALYSHGVVYWHHSLFQVVWLTQLVMAARIFRFADEGSSLRRRDVAILMIASLLAPAVEWTGYLASASIAGLSWWRGKSLARPDLRQLSMWILACPVVAGLGFVAHFASVVGFSPLLAALESRLRFRSSAHGSAASLAHGYVDSFGALLLFVPAIAAFYFALGRRRPGIWVAAVLLAVALPLVENLLLAQHAATYHFDRLKALVPMTTIVAISIALIPSHLQRRALLVWFAVLCWNSNDLSRSRAIGVTPPLATNNEMMQRVKETARPCAIYATNVEPRGWVDFTLGANAYEAVPSIDSVEQLVASRGACQGWYFRAARVAGQGMYVWQDASAIDPHGVLIQSIDWSATADYPRAHLPAIR